MTTYRTDPKILDKGSRLDHSGKSIRYTNGAMPELRTATISDHFTYGAGAFNSHVPQNWVTTETGAATPFAPSATTASGAAIGVTGATTNNAEEFAGKAVIWQPSTQATKKPLVLEVRAKFVGATTPTDGDFYIGFADAVTYASGLAYVVSAASALTTTAPSDFVGFGYSSIPTSGTLFTASGNVYGVVNSKAGVDAIVGTTVVKDSNYHIFRVELDVNGDARCFIDDKFVKYVQNATTAATKFTPYIGAIAKNSHALTATIDYVIIGGELT